MPSNSRAHPLQMVLDWPTNSGVRVLQIHSPGSATVKKVDSVRQNKLFSRDRFSTVNHYLRTSTEFTFCLNYHNCVMYHVAGSFFTRSIINYHKLTAVHMYRMGGLYHKKLEVGKLVTFRNPLLPVTRLVGTRYSVFVTLIVTG